MEKRSKYMATLVRENLTEDVLTEWILKNSSLPELKKQKDEMD